MQVIRTSKLSQLGCLPPLPDARIRRSFSQNENLVNALKLTPTRPPAVIQLLFLAWSATSTLLIKLL